MPTLNKSKRSYKISNKKHGDNAIAQKIYNTSKWQTLRKAYLMQHPLCESCLLKDKITPAQHVHHIRTILSGKDELEMRQIAFDPYNLMALCEPCHQEIHGKVNKNKRELFTG